MIYLKMLVELCPCGPTRSWQWCIFGLTGWQTSWSLHWSGMPFSI